MKRHPSYPLKASLAAAMLLVTPLSLAALPATAAEAVAPASEDKIEGVLPDGSKWQVTRPANWNHVLLLDLDGAGMALPGNMPRPGAGNLPPGVASMAAASNNFTAWLLSQGYAVGGTMREPVGYDFPKAVDNLVEVRKAVIAKWGTPKHTVAIGGSRGAFVVRKALELRPDIFDGGYLNSGGGAGEIAVLRNKLNALFVLKTLVDPESPLTLVNINPSTENAAVAALVAKALETPQGRARLAFSAAMQQLPLKSGGAPGTIETYNAQVDQFGRDFTFAAAVPVRAGVEKIAQGNVSWNTDADYAELLTRSGRRQMVEALYAQAGLSVEADLKTLSATPRISADPQAVRRAEPLMTYSGKIKGPLVNVDNDDPVDPAGDKLTYQALLKRKGTDGLFRLLWVDGVGHGGQTALDRAVGISFLMERLDTGRWSDTTLDGLHKRAAIVKAGSPVDLGVDTFFTPADIRPSLNHWDQAEWGTYGKK